ADLDCGQDAGSESVVMGCSGSAASATTASLNRPHGVTVLRAARCRPGPIETDPIGDAHDGRIVLREHWSAGLYGYLQEEAIHCGQPHALDIEVSGYCGILPRIDGSDLPFVSLGDHRVDAHDGVFGMNIVVTEFDHAVFMQDCLKAVHGGGPGHILDAASRFGQ